jgi:hypothetical protein
MVSLTLTTCKRLDLFVQTIESFVKHCSDIELFDTIIHYDDSSSDDDRQQMLLLLNSLFPNKLICTRRFNQETFLTKKRHSKIMKIWKQDTESMGLDYVFHLEDDWVFVKDFNITDGIEILKNRDDVALVGYSWEKKEFPSDIFVPEMINSYWEWFYSKNYEINEILWPDITEIKYLPVGHWVKIINWPYFGFRPAVHDIKKLKTLDTFNDTVDDFELEFAKRFSEKFKSFFHSNRITYHIGNEMSSYDINNSTR